MDTTPPPIIDTSAQPDMGMDPGFAPDPNAGTFVAPVEEKKKSHIGVIILAFLLVAALGFAGYEFYLGMQKDEQIASLESSVKTLKSQVSDLQEKLDKKEEEKKEEEKKEEEPTDPVYVKEGYLYVKDWGVKIAVPKDLKSLSFALGSSDLGTELEIWASTVEGSEFASEKNPAPLGSLTLVPDDAVISESMSTATFEAAGKKFLYTHPQAVYSTDPAEQEIEKASTELIKTMLSADNISKI